jgi:hypothetical protein
VKSTPPATDAKRKRGRPPRAVPVVTCKLTRCPTCAGVACLVERTLLREPEYLRQLMACQSCGKKFERIAD